MTIEFFTPIKGSYIDVTVISHKDESDLWTRDHKYPRSITFESMCKPLLGVIYVCIMYGLSCIIYIPYVCILRINILLYINNNLYLYIIILISYMYDICVYVCMSYICI